MDALSYFNDIVSKKIDQLIHNGSKTFFDPSVQMSKQEQVKLRVILSQQKYSFFEVRTCNCENGGICDVIIQL